MLGYLGTPWDTIGYQQCSKRPNQPIKVTITHVGTGTEVKKNICPWIIIVFDNNKVLGQAKGNSFVRY